MLSSVAAVLCVMLLIGSLIFTLQAARQHSTTLTLPLATATSISFTGPQAALQDLHMFDTHNGWATTVDEKRILHTTSGVTSWKDVTPIPPSSSAIFVGEDFFSPSIAWLAAREGNSSVLYRTRDGGQNWQKTVLPDQINGNCQISFIDAIAGWLLVGKVVAAGSEAVDVLRTSDGGASWKIVSTTSLTSSNSTALPPGGDKFGISFVNATTGWVSGFAPLSGFVWLYITRDGGVTWQQQTLPLPKEASNAQISAQPPIFFDDHTGILPILLNGSGQQMIVYTTRDAGASWTATSALPNVAALPQLTAFVDLEHGWLLANQGNPELHRTLYRTSDSGQHWEAFTTPFSADIVQLDFVSSAQGWAIDAAQRLYETRDGGENWEKRAPTIA